VTVLNSNPGDRHPPILPGSADGVSSPVCFNAGPFKGFEGIIVERRKSGRFLIQLHQGVYVEANLVEFSPCSPAADNA
jgi:hypothetical protein